MEELVIISGKGGTGKTSLVAAFACLAKNKALCDADVDAADLHLLMAPKIEDRHDFDSGHTAIINPDKCTQCGLCEAHCNWDAIHDFTVNAVDCEGCGVCYYICPEKAIGFPVNTCGEWYLSQTRFGPMAHARLGIAEENSGKLVSLIRKEGAKLAEKYNLDLLITDGPPGIGCPVIAAIGGATALLIVAEPTVSGEHDMIRVAQLADHFRVPALLCINKYDLNPEKGDEIIDYAKGHQIDYIGSIPFDPAFTKAMVMGKTILEYDDKSLGSLAVREIWEKVSEFIESVRS